MDVRLWRGCGPASSDLIILDLNLPGLGGLELLRRMIQMGVGPILVLSMHAEPLYRQTRPGGRAAGYMTKNASPDELLAAFAASRPAGATWKQKSPRLWPRPAAAADAARCAERPGSWRSCAFLAKGASLAEIAAAVGVGYKTRGQQLQPDQVQAWRIEDRGFWSA